MVTIDESRDAKNYTPGPQVGGVFGTPRRIESITIHHWGAFGQTHDGVLDWFCNPRSSVTTSAHYVVSDGRANCIVSPLDASWAAGNAYGNATSIHIECRPEATDGDYATVADVVRQLRALYGDLPLRPHNSWTPTSCPGQWDLERIDSIARGGVATASSETVTPISPEEDTLNAEQERKLNAVYDAIFNGGTSMPEGKPLKDLINDSFSAMRKEIKDLRDELAKVKGA